MNPRSLIPLGCITLMLVACSGENDDLRAWMDQQAQAAKPNVQPIAPPRKFEPEPYAGAGGQDPFSSGKLVAGTRLSSASSNALLGAEMKRRKEPLEAYPLDAMTMVGTVVKQGAPHALLRVDGLLHYVKVGDYLGQNFGKITRITETEIDLREIAQDASGEWIERTSTLQLQESGK
jgi:type IV pilus assembly protein PilP